MNFFFRAGEFGLLLSNSKKKEEKTNNISIFFVSLHPKPITVEAYGYKHYSNRCPHFSHYCYGAVIAMPNTANGRVSCVNLHHDNSNGTDESRYFVEVF